MSKKITLNITVDADELVDAIAARVVAELKKSAKVTTAKADPAPKDEEPEVPADSTVGGEEGTEEAQEVEVSEEEARAKCRELKDAKGLPAVTAVISKFVKTGGFANVKPKDYAALIAAIDVALGQEEDNDF